MMLSASEPNGALEPAKDRSVRGPDRSSFRRHRWFGVWCNPGWLRTSSGKIIYYPAMEIAEAHACELRAASDGGDYVAREFVVRERE